MQSILSYFLVAITLATASPVYQFPWSRRGLSSPFGDVVHDVSSTVNGATDAVQSVAAEASAAVDSALGSLPKLPPDAVYDAPLANDALWQEARSFDLKNNNGTDFNQMFYQIIGYYQKLESSSNSYMTNALSGSSWISRGLQYLHTYPTQFNQPQASYPAESLVQLSPTPQQTIESFGASGAWWPNFLKDFPSAQQKNLSSLLFSEDWLQLSGYRYNLGASGNKDNITVGTPGRGVESFMVTNGSYDWLRDGPGYYYLQAASEARVSSLTAFINSMPSALTTSQRPCGNSLVPAAMPQFVAYITTVLSHFSKNGININYISPMNEPDNDFDSCNQEGMSVSRNDRTEVFQLLRSALQASTSPTVQAIKIMGDETSQIASQALMEYSSWLTQTLSSKSIDAVAVHMYDWPDDATLLNYRQLVINSSLPSPPPPIKMTEISTFTSASGIYAPWGWTGPKIMGPEYDPGINSALDMARYIWQWLALVNAESWDWWTAVSNMMPCSPSKVPGCATTYSNSQSPAGYNDGLLYIDPIYATTKDYNFYFTKRFWVFKHFTKFLRPGAIRFDVPNEILPYGTVAVAARNTNDVYSTIFINRNATTQTIRMKLPGKGGRITAVVQTTDKDDFKNLLLPAVRADGTFRIALPARGVLSIQFTDSAKAAGVVTSKRGEEHDVGFLYDRGKGA